MSSVITIKRGEELYILSQGRFLSLKGLTYQMTLVHDPEVRLYLPQHGLTVVGRGK